MQSTPRDKKIFAIAVTILFVVFVFFATYYFLLIPLNQEIETNTKKLSEAQVKVEESKRAEVDLIRYQQQINELLGGSVENSKLLEKEINMASFMSTLNSAASKSNVTMTEYSFNGNAAYIKGGLIGNGEESNLQEGTTPPKPSQNSTTQSSSTQENFQKLETSITIKGTYSQLREFINECESCGNYVVINSLNVNVSSKSSEYSGTMKLSVYSTKKFVVIDK